MARLTAKEIHGIWACSVMCWDEKFRFDVDAYAEKHPRDDSTQTAWPLHHWLDRRVYAIDFDEFKTMVDVQAELCGEGRIPLQIGCCADATHKTLRLFEYAASKKEVALPRWWFLIGWSRTIAKCCTFSDL